MADHRPLPVVLDERSERSAAPAAVRVALERLADEAPLMVERAAEDPGIAGALVAVLAASRSLTRVIDSRPVATIDVLADIDRRPSADDIGDVTGLVEWRDLEFLRIAARDLVGLDALEQVGDALARLGRDVLAHACRLTDDDSGRLTVIGMGKLAGEELNYSSDIDVMFVGDGPRRDLERRARAIMDVARRCFRVDANLRPEGRDGPLVRTIDSYASYWERWAEPWEFQALLKARPAAGDPELGARWLEVAQRALWARPFDADALRSLRSMKARAEAEVARKGIDTRELKRGPGGIRDIEFTVQLLQLVHGHLDPDLRGATTLTMLAEMAREGYIDEGDGDRMAVAYRLLRTVEHRLQLVDEQQVHTIPDDEPRLDHLARVMGRRDTPEGTASEHLLRELRSTQATVRSIHERVYFRPLLEAFAAAGPTEAALDPEATEARLLAFGFADAARTQAAMRDLTRGLNRSSRLMQQLLPLLLDWLSQSPDPDLGLLQVRNLLTGPRASRQIAETFRDSPAAARALCTVAGTSRLLGDVIAANPDLVARLDDPDRLATQPLDVLVDRATTALRLREGDDERQASLRRWQQRNLLGIGARDVLGEADVRRVGHDLAILAEGTVRAALDSIGPKVEFAVLGLGRFGGSELAYASDLDLAFVHRGTTTADIDEARRVAQSLMRMIGGSTPARRIYEVDADLRPEGRSGPLSRSLESWLSYWRDQALTWERQAMTRARVVAGDAALGSELLGRLDQFVWEPGLSAEGVREIRRMKARIENERIPMGEDPDFHLKLGRGSLSDIEFTVQMLQLQAGVRAPGTLDAITALAAEGVLDPTDADVLAESYAFCEQVRNRWFLVNSGPGDSLPTQPESLLWLARAMDTTPGGLREHYRRVTRRTRTVVERVFYGLPGRH
ncbi:MAG: bifunctional [glutamine synthetase] adenylyltransferase/[glutamine synthetase]-adenylyl-L-tyrosine phosphorylase [Acidimicrobiia bacterium]|nr:bifunctional [glutamine synthetase] adenylyltransferase/[glutamine synthetase]-adenylyl-L-tyrosine phosphorylase [Acidimicrobiia bacterium]